MLLSLSFVLACAGSPPAPAVAAESADAPPHARVSLDVPELVGARIRVDIPVRFAAGDACEANDLVQLHTSDVAVLQFDPVEGASEVRWSVDELSGSGPADAGELRLGGLDPISPGPRLLCVQAHGAEGVVASYGVQLALAAPIYTQVGVMELGWDGVIAQTGVTHRVVRGHQSIAEERWISSDFVRTWQVTDEGGDPLALDVTHDAGSQIHHYRATLPAPAVPGSLLVLVSHSVDDGSRVTQPEPGVFEYEMRHHPNSGQPTRSLGVFRLPEGAVLLDASDGIRSRERDGRLELVHMQIIEAGGSKHTRFRYRMAPP